MAKLEDESASVRSLPSADYEAVRSALRATSRSLDDIQGGTIADKILDLFIIRVNTRKAFAFALGVSLGLLLSISVTYAIEPFVLNGGILNFVTISITLACGALASLVLSGRVHKYEQLMQLYSMRMRAIEEVGRQMRSDGASATHIEQVLTPWRERSLSVLFRDLENL